MSNTTPDNSCLKADLIQNVLVITPQGDALGYSSNAVGNELNHLLDLFSRNDDLTDIVIDLQGSAYFGSLVIGAIARLAEAASKKNGRCIVADTSDEMANVLQVMHVDKIVEFRDSVEGSVAVLAKNPLRYRSKPLLKYLAAACVVLASAGVGYAYLNGGSLIQEEEDLTSLQIYRRMSALRNNFYSEIEMERLKPAPNWNSLSKQFSSELEFLIKKLSAEDGGAPTGKTSIANGRKKMYEAATTILTEHIKNPESAPKESPAELETLMTEAQNFLYHIEVTDDEAVADKPEASESGAESGSSTATTESGLEEAGNSKAGAHVKTDGEMS